MLQHERLLWKNTLQNSILDIVGFQFDKRESYVGKNRVYLHICLDMCKFI